MKLAADYQKYTLHFKFNAGTSRGILTSKDTYFIKVWEKDNPQVYGLGECSVLKGLSLDDTEGYEAHLKAVCAQLHKFSATTDYEAIFSGLISNYYPSIQFGFEMALQDLLQGGKRILYQSSFTDGVEGISINGLIWMGEEEFMRKQIDAKLQQGYTCLKLKIGALDFDKECALLKYIRSNYSKEQITLRVDANGAFRPDEVFEKLTRLSQFDIHSIEQPIKQGQREHMRILCRQTPLRIALDEELIGIMTIEDKRRLLEEIHPHYIILKPSLLGGISHTKEWITLCEELQVGWWITSALESNIGLNAISQFTATLHNPLPQGLGTGQLYSNNIASPLEIVAGNLYYKENKGWDIEKLFK